MAEHLFWISLLFVAYVYAGYPALLAVWQKLARRDVSRSEWEPTVSLVIAAYDERRVIERKILNCLDLDYPKDRLQIVVSLDGPTDGTEAIVRRYHDCGIEAVHSRVHRGKAAALNAGVRAARGEIVMFADARQRLDRRAVRELVAAFADHRVGAVTGELVLLDGGSGEASDAVGLYWRYEKKLRALESRIHSVLGATGSIYAIRRQLYRPLPEDTILDDVVVPMRLVLAGWRSVFEPRARAYDTVAPTPEVEYGRKVRTLTGNYQLLADMPELLAPWRNPVWLQFVSHKVGRLLVPYFLIALLVSNFFLSGPYLVALACQIAWYGLAGAGWFFHSYAGARGSGRLGARPSNGRGRAHGACEVETRSDDEGDPGVDRPWRGSASKRSRATPDMPAAAMRPPGCGGAGPSAALPLLDDVHRHRLRRVALHPSPRRSQRDPSDYSDGPLTLRRG